MRERKTAKGAAYLIGGLVALVLGAAGMGAIYQAVISARERRLYPMPGKLVDVGSYRLHIDCLGAGSPTVVLENGSGDSMLEWMSVQPEIAKFARVCAYDRAGLGWSDPDSAPRTTEGVTRDLHALLANAGIAPPYVLVGHSMGGFFVSRYAAQYPDEVVGAVLVDPAGPGQNKIFPAEFMRAIDPFYFHDRIASLTAPMGLPRIMGWCSPDYAPPQYRSQLAMVDCAPKTFDAAVAEDDYRKNGADDLSQWPAQGSLGNIPLLVFSHDPSIPMLTLPASPAAQAQAEKAWGDFNEQLTRLSSDGSRMIAKGSKHYIQFDRPDIVIDGVRKVVERAKRRLSM